MKSSAVNLFYSESESDENSPIRESKSRVDKFEGPRSEIGKLGSRVKIPNGYITRFKSEEKPKLEEDKKAAKMKDRSSEPEDWDADEFWRQLNKVHEESEALYKKNLLSNGVTNP